MVADSRAPRDGKFIEKIGTYNPNTNPSTVAVNVDKAVKWLQNGAQPTDTARSILSRKGVLYKRHLLGGVAKGALTMEQVESKFAAWVEVKEAQTGAVTSGLNQKIAEAAKARLAEETRVNQERIKAIAAKNTPPAVEEENNTTEETVAE